MDTNHSKYFELHPKEAMKKFSKKLSIVRYIAIFFLVLLLCFYIYGLFKFADKSIWSLMMLICIIIALIVSFLCRILPYMESRQLQMVLYMDCAPVKMLDIVKLWEQKDRLGKAKNTFLMLKAQCSRFIPELWEEGLQNLQQVNFKQKFLDRESNRLLLFAQYSRIRGDRESFEKVKLDMEQLPNLYPGRKNQKAAYEKVWNLLKLEESLWDGKKDEARGLLNCLLEKEVYQINKVQYHMNLARLDVEAEDYENAKQHLNYVIANGNQLPIVAEAKNRLEAIDKS